MAHIKILNYLILEQPLGMVQLQKLQLSGGSITNFDVIDGGSGYGAEKLEFDPTFMGSPTIGGCDIYISWFIYKYW